jgi:hypothetical protein
MSSDVNDSTFLKSDRLKKGPGKTSSMQSEGQGQESLKASYAKTSHFQLSPDFRQKLRSRREQALARGQSDALRTVYQDPKERTKRTYLSNQIINPKLNPTPNASAETKKEANTSKKINPEPPPTSILRKFLSPHFGDDKNTSNSSTKNNTPTQEDQRNELEIINEIRTRSHEQTFLNFTHSMPKNQFTKWNKEDAIKILKEYNFPNPYLYDSTRSINTWTKAQKHDLVECVERILRKWTVDGQANAIEKKKNIPQYFKVSEKQIIEHYDKITVQGGFSRNCISLFKKLAPKLKLLSENTEEFSRDLVGYRNNTHNTIMESLRIYETILIDINDLNGKRRNNPWMIVCNIFNLFEELFELLPTTWYYTIPTFMITPDTQIPSIDLIHYIKRLNAIQEEFKNSMGYDLYLFLKYYHKLDLDEDENDRYINFIMWYHIKNKSYLSILPTLLITTASHFLTRINPNRQEVNSLKAEMILQTQVINTVGSTWIFNDFSDNILEQGIRAAKMRNPKIMNPYKGLTKLLLKYKYDLDFFKEIDTLTDNHFKLYSIVNEDYNKLIRKFPNLNNRPFHFCEPTRFNKAIKIKKERMIKLPPHLSWQKSEECLIKKEKIIIQYKKIFMNVKEPIHKRTSINTPLFNQLSIPKRKIRKPPDKENNEPQGNTIPNLNYPKIKIKKPPDIKSIVIVTIEITLLKYLFRKMKPKIKIRTKLTDITLYLLNLLIQMQQSHPCPIESLIGRIKTLIVQSLRYNELMASPKAIEEIINDEIEATPYREEASITALEQLIEEETITNMMPESLYFSGNVYSEFSANRRELKSKFKEPYLNKNTPEEWFSLEVREKFNTYFISYPYTLKEELWNEIAIETITHWRANCPFNPNALVVKIPHVLYEEVSRIRNMQELVGFYNLPLKKGYRNSLASLDDPYLHTDAFYFSAELIRKGYDGYDIVNICIPLAIRIFSEYDYEWELIMKVYDTITKKKDGARLISDNGIIKDETQKPSSIFKKSWYFSWEEQANLPNPPTFKYSVLFPSECSTNLLYSLETNFEDLQKTKRVKNTLEYLLTREIMNENQTRIAILKYITNTIENTPICMPNIRYRYWECFLNSFHKIIVKRMDSINIVSNEVENWLKGFVIKESTRKRLELSNYIIRTAKTKTLIYKAA